MNVQNAEPEIAPACQVHGGAMRKGKFSWFCPRSIGDGVFCDQKVKLPKMVPVLVPAASLPSAPQTLADNNPLALKLAALNFAGQAMQGHGTFNDNGESLALMLARDAFLFLTEGT